MSKYYEACSGPSVIRDGGVNVTQRYVRQIGGYVIGPLALLKPSGNGMHRHPRTSDTWTRVVEVGARIDQRADIDRAGTRSVLIAVHSSIGPLTEARPLTVPTCA